MKIPALTNATKAQLIALANAVLALLTTFHVSLTQTQDAAIIVLVNAALALWVGLTYKSSPTRTADPPAS